MKLFIKRLLLIFVGIILSLVLLECGLRLAGWTISSYQQYKNNKALRNKSKYTIMCLGESTTQGQYPVQLQQILDAKYPNKFSVIDCGIRGTFLDSILSMIDNNINKYNPNIAICMMGINDDFVIADLNKDIYSSNKTNCLKIYKLLILFKLHLKHILKQNVAFAEKINLDISFDQAINLKKLGKFKESKELLTKLLQQEPNNEIYFVELMILYLDYNDWLNTDINIAYDMAKMAFDKGFKTSIEWYYYAIFKFCIENNNIELLNYYVNKAIKEDYPIFYSHLKTKIYLTISNFISKEQKDKIISIMLNNANDRTYGFFAIQRLCLKDYKKATEYFEKSEEIRLQFPNTKTYNLYKLIVEKLIDNNIKVICMQYPVRSLKPLQEQLKNEPYYKKVTFISNEKLFRENLMTKNYADLFGDQFAGDFGHCTDLGNTLIAKNVVNSLEKILDLK